MTKFLPRTKKEKEMEKERLIRIYYGLPPVSKDTKYKSRKIDTLLQPFSRRAQHNTQEASRNRIVRDASRSKQIKIGRNNV